MAKAPEKLNVDGPKGGAILKAATPARVRATIAGLTRRFGAVNVSLAHKPKPKPKPKPKKARRPRTILLREKLVQAELAAAKAGIREVGGNNHGPWVKKFLAEVGLPQGYAWCDAFQSYMEHKTAGHKLAIESASVAATVAKARQLGWIVDRPLRGDLVAYDFDGDGRCDDHIGIVVRVLRLGPTLTLQTVEGNTGDGSPADDDGVYLRTRVVARRSVCFVRIPGRVAA